MTKNKNRKNTKASKKSKKNTEKREDITYIETITDKVIKTYYEMKRVNDAERLKQIVSLIMKEDDPSRILDPVIDSMFNTLKNMLENGRREEALKYFIKCLDTPDTLVAFLYMLKPERAEIMLSIIAKTLTLLSRVSSINR